MKHKFIPIISILLLVLSVVCFFLLKHNSQTIALRNAGIDVRERIQELDTDEFGGSTFRILQCQTTEGDLALVHLTQNKLGFWTVFTLDTEALGFVQYDWHSFSSSQVYPDDASPDPQIVYNREYHFAYCGNNAQQLIDFPEEAIPPNMTIGIEQIGSFYLIHAIAYADTRPTFDITSLLREYGFVQFPAGD